MLLPFTQAQCRATADFYRASADRTHPYATVPNACGMDAFTQRLCVWRNVVKATSGGLTKRKLRRNGKGQVVSTVKSVWAAKHGMGNGSRPRTARGSLPPLPKLPASALLKRADMFDAAASGTPWKFPRQGAMLIPEEVRVLVYRGVLQCTKGKLRREDLEENAQGRLVSKYASDASAESYADNAVFQSYAFTG